jgi:hypothetical protein
MLSKYNDFFALISSEYNREDLRMYLIKKSNQMCTSGNHNYIGIGLICDSGLKHVLL